MISIVITTRDRKQNLFDLLESIKKFPPKTEYEIVVVDDFSEEDIKDELLKKFKVQFIKNSKREGLIKSRNAGWRATKNEIVLIIDDDNEIKDDNFFEIAEQKFNENSKIGILGCISYYFDEPETIQFGPTIFNKYTGKTTFIGVNTSEIKSENGLVKTHDVPNAFFTRRAVLLKTGGFSDEIIQTFSEADYAEKVRKINFEVFQCTELKVYHKSPKMDFAKISVRHMGGSPWRFYYLMRNRFVFIKKWATLIQKITFSLFFSHLYTIYYIGHLIRLKEKEMIVSGLYGVRDGYIYMLTGKLINHYEQKN
jgi:GT2 family glycosyltransferase